MQGIIYPCMYDLKFSFHCGINFGLLSSIYFVIIFFYLYNYRYKFMCSMQGLINPGLLKNEIFFKNVIQIQLAGDSSRFRLTKSLSFTFINSKQPVIAAYVN